MNRSPGFFKGNLFIFLTGKQTCFELIAHTEFEILVLSRYSFFVEILIVKGPIKSGLLRIEIRSVSIRSWSAKLLRLIDCNNSLIARHLFKN